MIRAIPAVNPVVTGNGMNLITPPSHGQFARRAAGCEDEGVGAESDPERRQGILVSVHSNAAADIRTLQYPIGPAEAEKAKSVGP